MTSEDLFLFETNGFSMWPFLKSGEKLIIKKLPLKVLKTGNIILYQADEQKVCHRLIKKVKDRNEYLLYVRGDNSLSSPEAVAGKYYLGRAIAIMKNGKTIDLTTKEQCFINWVIVFFAPAVSWCARIIKRFY